MSFLYLIIAILAAVLEAVLVPIAGLVLWVWTLVRAEKYTGAIVSAIGGGFVADVMRVRPLGATGLVLVIMIGIMQKLPVTQKAGWQSMLLLLLFAGLDGWQTGGGWKQLIFIAFLCLVIMLVHNRLGRRTTAIKVVRSI